jgi:SagB-type dehydrogenase family enzyme
LRLLWREGVTAVEVDQETLMVQGSAGRMLLRRIAPALLAALRRLNPPGEDEEDLVERVKVAGNDSAARWYYYVERLHRRGFLCRSAYEDETRLATLVGLSSSFVWKQAQVGAEHRYVLSRFAYLSRSRGDVALESPLVHARVNLSDRRAAALVGALAMGSSAEELAKQAIDIPVDAVAAVLTLLIQSGMLDEVDEEGSEEESALQTWEFHDMVFHARSRMGRDDAPHGGTFRFVNRLSPPPALRPAHAGESKALYRPDLALLERSDPPLAHVQERRRSIRDFDSEQPISDRQLGEFLFRVARVKECWQAEIATDHARVSMDFTSRLYPAGGSLYELEVYVAVNRCLDLQPGLYHYDPLEHRLTRVSGRTVEVGRLFQDAAESAAIPEDEVQLLLILAARFPRVAWKYQSIAYSLILKHVGVVFQTMYMAATAMGLAPCAVGCGDSDLFARAAGTDYWTETSVGEFLLGSQKERAE